MYIIGARKILKETRNKTPKRKTVIRWNQTVKKGKKKSLSKKEEHRKKLRERSFGTEHWQRTFVAAELTNTGDI